LVCEVAMSGHGGHRPGSGRKRIYASKKQSNIVWQRGHRRISIDGIVYSSWVAARIKCGYKTDSDFASHLLSLERRRRLARSTLELLFDTLFCFLLAYLLWTNTKTMVLIGRMIQLFHVRRGRGELERWCSFEETTPSLR